MEQSFKYDPDSTCSDAPMLNSREYKKNDSKDRYNSGVLIYSDYNNI